MGPPPCGWPDMWARCHVLVRYGGLPLRKELRLRRGTPLWVPGFYWQQRRKIALPLAPSLKSTRFPLMNMVRPF
ncbi:hypothetical protein GURASL_17330 [Geotalea uraniireducens]|uniref:Uncharacterized protein n=1 Tax=Geotalea uraniireducens TaxID=351604 RepID=A0ABM8EJU9_9BACT|nr:hypothetical protein GURASL_17330 [Geotalea uraniireducens]